MFWSSGQASQKKNKSKAKIPQRMRFRRNLEMLEDRRLLAVLTVSTTVDRLDASVVPGHPYGPGHTLSLREAIFVANANPGSDTIRVPNGTYNLTLGTLNITDSVTIQGTPGAHPTIVGQAGTRVFDVPTTTPPISLEFDDLTIKGGGGAAVTGNGAGVHIENGLDTVTFRRSTVTGNNAAGNGGGVADEPSGAIPTTINLFIIDSTISGNTAGSNGGGIWAKGTSSLQITGSTLSGNTATGGNGGGAFIASIGTSPSTTVLGAGSLISNSTIGGNSANNGNGGGVDFEGGGSSTVGTLAIGSTTIAHNSAKNGGGVYRSTLNAGVGVANTIIALNTFSTGGANSDVSGAFGDGGGNLIGIVTGGTGFTVSTLLGTAGTPLDPLIGPLANNGGPTQTYALLVGSPAISAASVNVSLIPPTDQRGVARPQGTGPDIGAYEYPTPPKKDDHHGSCGNNNNNNYGYNYSSNYNNNYNNYNNNHQNNNHWGSNSNWWW